MADAWTDTMDEKFNALVKQLDPALAIAAIGPVLRGYREFAKLARETIVRLAGEKEDMKPRNQLLRLRLDQHPERAVPRLAILDRLDRAEARVRELETPVGTSTGVVAVCLMPDQIEEALAALRVAAATVPDTAIGIQLERLNTIISNARDAQRGPLHQDRVG